MNLLMRDLRFGVRSLSRTPGATTIAILSLALGVGANAVVFSLVNALLLRPLPVEAPQELVRKVFDAAEAGEYEVTADELTTMVKAGLSGPIEALYPQLAAPVVVS